MKNKKSILMKMGFLLLAVFLTVFTTKAQVGALIWEENFNTIDPAIWSYDVGDGCAIGLCGWGNQELQYYRSENSRIEAVSGEAGNNALVIEAKREAFGGKSFTSSRIKSTEGVAVQYGMIEIRLQVPNLQTGLWPAAWMLGTTTATWPAKGEIDIMEMGHSTAEKTRQGYPSTSANNFAGSNLIFYATGACSDGNPSCAASTAYDVNYDKPYIAATALNGRFVKYRLYWTSTEMRFTIIDNNVEYDLYESPFLISEESQEFQAPFYFLLNLAVGGAFTDALNDAQVTAPLPGKMLVDYIRVYKFNNQGDIIIGSTAIKESGTFGLFTDNTPTTNKLEAGVSSDIYAWNNFALGTTTAYEGSNVIAWQTTAANTWFGGGIATRQARDMSSFSGGNLKFRIKIPANVTFKVGITDNYTNQFYVNFPANTTTYGLVRNGEWAQATIPISTLTGGLIALQSMQYLFAIVSVDGALPTSTFQIGLDDIYWEGGGGVVTVPVTGISLSPTSASKTVGTTQQLTATITPSNATNKTVNWTTSNAAVATVNSSGLVTAVAVGTATITGTTQDGGRTATSAITVTSGTVSVTGVSVSPTSASIAVGGTNQLTATVLPSNATDKTVVWSSSNAAIASVNSSGLVTGVAAGSATITVRTNNGGFTATSAITVTAVVTQTPYSGVIPIPGTVQSENYDNGGEGVAYHDVDVANKTAAYRTDGVDIEACSEGGYNIDYSENGEWLEYTVNVATTGSYNLNARVAAPIGGTFHVEFDGVNVSGTMTVPNTTGWQVWQTVTKVVSLTAGQHIMRFFIDTKEFNTNYISFTAVTTTVPVTSVSISPTSASLTVGGTQQLTPTVLPTNATNKSVTYATSNAGVASVNSSGLVTAISAGTATITVTTVDQARTATCAVTVTASTLTDITNLAGTITTQYTGSPANEGVAKLIDNSSSTKFLTFYASAWVQYQVSSGYIVTSYSMTSANDAAERDPLNWTLQGSTNGTTWVTINTQTAQDFATRLLKRTFSFTNTTSYAYYRLNMTNNSGTILQLAELELFGVPGTTTIPVTGVTMSPTTASISVAGTQQLTATVAPANATNKTVTWTTSNSAIAIVNASGLVTGVAAGTATITVTTQDGARTATCAVTVTTVTVPVTGVTMSPTTASILVAGTQQLTATVAPANATNKAVTWTTSNSAVATVNASGLVTGIAAGTATITVTTQNGARTATCAVTVTPSSVFTTKIEAESYTSMLGVQTEATTDAGAGLNVGWIEAADWMAYPAVNIPTAGTYTIEYRVASMNGGGNLQFELAGGTPVYGTLAVPSTGGWQTWSTIKHTVTLSAGSQSFAIVALAGGWNINWFAITQGVKSASEQSNFVSKTSEIELYPNPASDFLSILHHSTTSELNVKVYSLTGNLIIESDMANESSLDISSLNSGTYIVRVSTDTDVQNKIFIKK